MGFTRKKCENQKLPVEIYSVFVGFWHIVWPQCMHKYWGCKLRENGESLCFVDFKGQINVEKH